MQRSHDTLASWHLRELDRHPPSEMATAADGTHLTGMHLVKLKFICYVYVVLKETAHSFEQ